MLSTLSPADAPSSAPHYVCDPRQALTFHNNTLLRPALSAPVFASPLSTGFPDVARIPESNHRVFTTAPNGKQRAYYATSDASSALLSHQGALNRCILSNQLDGIMLGSIGVLGGAVLSTATYFFNWPSAMYALSIGLPPAIFGYFYAKSQIAFSELEQVNQKVDKQVEYIDFEPKSKPVTK